MKEEELPCPLKKRIKLCFMEVINMANIPQELQKTLYPCYTNNVDQYAKQSNLGVSVQTLESQETS